MFIVIAEDEDKEEILALQKLAFIIQAQIYNDYTISPLVETLSEFKADLENKTVYKAVIDGKIVGAVRIHTDESTCYIGKLCVLPEVHGQGIGTRLLNEVEHIYNEYKRFELFVGSKSIDNIRLYERLGYKKFKSAPYSEKANINYMEKIIIYVDSVV